MKIKSYWLEGREKRRRREEEMKREKKEILFKITMAVVDDSQHCSAYTFTYVYISKWHSQLLFRYLYVFHGVVHPVHPVLATYCSSVPISSYFKILVSLNVETHLLWGRSV